MYMRTQKEIRKEVVKYIRSYCSELGNEAIVAKLLLEYLDSQGGVLKVEGELPEIGYYFYEHEKSSYLKAQQDMVNDGFVKTEPLIKEKLTS